MEARDFSRRQFLLQSVVGAGSAWLAAAWPEVLAAQQHAHHTMRAVDSGAPAKLDFLTPAQAADVEAIARLIIPTTDMPGAREARSPIPCHRCPSSPPELCLSAGLSNWAGTRTGMVTCHATSLPVETNSISLDPEVKEWGLPAIRVTYKDHPDDLKTCQYLLDRAMELLDATPALRKWRDPVSEQEHGYQLLGTCCMGNDPKTSVIDADHRTHDVPNLFLCDGSSLVTSGRGQPTMTIQALAYRAADRIVRLAKRGELGVKA